MLKNMRKGYKVTMAKNAYLRGAMSTSNLFHCLYGNLVLWFRWKAEGNHKNAAAIAYDAGSFIAMWRKH